MTYIPDDVWNEIKSYMGVYNITTDWYKLEKVGGARLNNYYKQNYRRRITNAQHNPEKVRKMIYNKIFKNMTFTQANDLYELIKPKKVIKKVEVGDVITHHNPATLQINTGIVIKVNKCSVRYKPFQLLKEVDGRFYWDKNKFYKPQSVKDFQTKDDEGFNPDFYEGVYFKV